MFALWFVHKRRTRLVQVWSFQNDAPANYPKAATVLRCTVAELSFLHLCVSVSVCGSSYLRCNAEISAHKFRTFSFVINYVCQRGCSLQFRLRRHHQYVWLPPYVLARPFPSSATCRRRCPTPPLKTNNHIISSLTRSSLLLFHYPFQCKCIPFSSRSPKATLPLALQVLPLFRLVSTFGQEQSTSSPHP